MKHRKKRNYKKGTGKIIILKKVKSSVKEYIKPTISSLISTLITSLLFSTNTVNIAINSTDIYFLILSAMILFTYYYLHKH